MSNQIITLAEAKLHLKVDQSDEDSLITLYMAAAQESIEKFLNRPIPFNNLQTPAPPPSIKVACLIMVADMYGTRGVAVSIDENPMLMRLLQPFRVRIGI